MKNNEKDSLKKRIIEIGEILIQMIFESFDELMSYSYISISIR
jgi:hypothetical protein